MVTVTDNVITVTVTATERDFTMSTSNVKFLEIVANAGTSFSKKRFPVMHETKSFWIIHFSGDLERKVMKSTCRIAGSDASSWVFAECVKVYHTDETVTVTENVLDVAPVKRPVGRPKSGNALTPAEKQARYRARQAEKTVTVTFNREHLATLKTLLANAPESLGLPADQLDSLAKSVFDAALK